MPATRAALIERMREIDSRLASAALSESALAEQAELRRERAVIEAQLKKLEPADDLRDKRILRG